MTPDVPDSPEAELAEHEEKKEDEVLEREGVEQELMQSGASDVGEDLEDVQEDAKGESRASEGE